MSYEPTTPADRAAEALRLGDDDAANAVQRWRTDDEAVWVRAVRSLLPALAADVQTLTAERDTAVAVAGRLLDGWKPEPRAHTWRKTSTLVYPMTDAERTYILHHREASP